MRNMQAELYRRFFAFLRVLFFALSSVADSMDLSPLRMSFGVAPGMREFLAFELVEGGTPVPSEVLFVSNDLYIFPFNVGQANFIVMRMKDNIVVIDAGIGSSSLPMAKLLPLILYVFKGATVKAVFLTHPHKDHYDLLTSEGMPLYLGLSSSPCSGALFILGGKENDWKNTEMAKFLLKMSPQLRHFYEGPKFYSNIMSNVLFRVFGLTSPSSGGNKLSLMIHVSYRDKNVLFTGDAEGDSVDRMQGTVDNLQQLSALLKLYVPISSTSTLNAYHPTDLIVKIKPGVAQDIFHQVPFYQKNVKKTLTSTKLTEILQFSVSMVTGEKCASRR